MKKLLRALLILVCVVLALAAAGILYLTVTEYKPDDVELVEPIVSRGGEECPKRLTILSWNVGYCGLGSGADFVLDGGTSNGTPASREVFDGYYAGVLETLRENPADVYLLQEVDIDSARSFGVNEAESLSSELDAAYAAHALNYSCAYVPFAWPPIGRVESGVMTLTGLTAEPEATRLALPCPFKWPVSAANLKRCLLVTRVPLPETDKQLVLVDLHLEAYDDGEGKAAQTAMLLSVLREEYEKGNYVIAGGDFNQSFPGALEQWPVKDATLWTPGELDGDALDEGWSYATDVSTPTCRLLNMSYDPDDAATQYYVIDGFILSPNVTIESVATIDAGFLYSDHNPVRLRVSLEPYMKTTQEGQQ